MDSTKIELEALKVVVKDLTTELRHLQSDVAELGNYVTEFMEEVQSQSDVQVINTKESYGE